MHNRSGEELIVSDGLTLLPPCSGGKRQTLTHTLSGHFEQPQKGAMSRSYTQN